MEQPEHAIPAIADAEAVFDKPAEILGPPAAHPVAFRVGATPHQGLERHQLAVIEPARAAAPGSITQTLDAFGLEADHPVPERIAG
jgi:hypothetical protein